MKLPEARDRGFALVVTSALLVVLVVLAVGLLSLASISVRSASRDVAAAEAQANARMALMLAIGRLQEEMGPDMRISAPADERGAYAWWVSGENQKDRAQSAISRES